jgi:uncharacterized protein (DUF433 family)
MATTKVDAQLIVRDPRIHGGEPTIRGTRVPVRTVVLSLEDYGGDPQRLADDFQLERAAVDAALSYYRSHKVEIDRIVETHERATLA